MVIYLFPYLPLSRRIVVRPWTLIPPEDLSDADAVSTQAAELARGVHALYRFDGNRPGFGAFVRSAEPVGNELDVVEMSRLRLSVVAALLDTNPSLADPEHVPENAGHRICTSENAFVIGHGIDDHGYTGYVRGTMSQMWVGGPKVGESRDVIAPPSELMLPLMRPQIDDVYCTALYEVLSNLDDDSPDLPGAIQWLEVGWSNSISVSAPTHVLALRAGFDVLFGGADTQMIRGKLSDLLDPPGTPKSQREWDDHHGRHLGPFELTDLEWWFQSFALLRNRVAHGGEVALSEYEFDDGVDHVWHAELNLRRAIKQTVANAGHPEVLLDPFDRAMLRAAERIREDLGNELAE
jgi:hypothetical protein